MVASHKPLILVADDVPSNRDMLRTRLTRAGFEVVEACDGAEAVAKATTLSPDLIVMDISMPAMDGLEAWRMIQEVVDQPPLAIAVTATTIADVKLACLEAGFSDYLTKPIDFASLLRSINALLGEQASRQA
jgi:CheY-like chemotaxis protein